MFISGAVSEGGHHVPSALSHCPAVLLYRALESTLRSGTVRAEGEHLLQVLKHVIKESISEGPLLKLPPVSVHSFLMGMEVAVKVSLLASLILGVEVVLVSLLVVKIVKVLENVIKVEVKGLVVLSEVICASSSSSSSVALPWQRAMAILVILPSPLVI